MFKRVWHLGAILLLLLAAGCGSDTQDDDKDDSAPQPSTTNSTLTRYTDATVTPLGTAIEAALLATYPDLAETNVDGETELAPILMGITLSPTGQHTVLWLRHYDDEADTTTYLTCVYDLPSSAVTCNPTDERFYPLEDGLMVWSPDGRYLALHNEWAMRFDDPDILLVDVEQAKLLNLTGLPMEGNRIQDVYDGEMVVIDYAPFWSTDGANLYFFRTQPTVSAEDDRMSDWPPLTLMRVAVGEWTFEEVMPVPDPITFQRLIATNQIDMAPDGKQVAALLIRLPNADGTTDLYRFNIETGEAELWFGQADLMALMPSWVDATSTLLYPMDVEWSADGQQVVVAFMAEAYADSISLMVYGLIDVATNTLTPLVTWDEVADTRAFFEVNPVIPKRVLFAPNGSSVVSINGPARVAEDDAYSVTGRALIGEGERYDLPALTLPADHFVLIQQARYTSAVDTLGAQQSALLSPPNARLERVYLLTLAE